MAVATGPTANLPGYTRRSGLAGSVLIASKLQGEVVALEWGVEVEQIQVRIPGQYRMEVKPGGETRTGSFRVQDVHDKWALILYSFIQARRTGSKSAASLPEFDIVSKLDDIGAPQVTRWQLDGCQIFRMDGGWDQETDLLQRDIPFSYRRETPLDAFEYVDGDSPGTFIVKPYAAAAP